MTASMNLLPASYRRGLLVRHRIRQWRLLWFAAAAISCAVCAARGNSLIKVRGALAALQVRNLPLVEMQSQSHEFAMRIAALEGRESILNELTGVQQPLGLIAVVSRSAQQADRRLQVRTLAIQHLAPTEIAKKNSSSSDSDALAAAQSPTVEITIRGVAIDDVAVARFVQALTDTNLFLSVELKSTLSVEHTDGPVRHYDVLCRR